MYLKYIAGMDQVKIFPSLIYKKILPAKILQIKVYQFYVRMVILEHLQMTAILCLSYIYLKPQNTYMCNDVRVHTHTHESVLCEHMKRCPKVQQTLAPTLDLPGGLHLFPDV